MDDHPIVAKALRDLLNQQDDLAACGSADDHNSALTQIELLNPDLVVLDISLKTGNGIELLKDIKLRHPKIPVVILTVHDEEVYSARAIRAGASGFVMKREAPEDVVGAIREVLEGGVYLSDRMAKKMLFRFTGRIPEKDSPLDALNDRELEALKLIGEGLTTPDIARQLFVSVNTVECYREQIKKKLHLNSTRELLQAAIHWLHKN